MTGRKIKLMKNLDLIFIISLILYLISLFFNLYYRLFLELLQYILVLKFLLTLIAFYCFDANIIVKFKKLSRSLHLFSSFFRYIPQLCLDWNQWSAEVPQDSCGFHGYVQPSFVYSPYFNFSHRFDFNVRTLTQPNDTAIVGHDELMMTTGWRKREVEILTASWRRVRRQSGETSLRAWIGVSEQPVQSTRRPHIRARNVIRARWPIRYLCTTRCNSDCRISSTVSERMSHAKATWVSITWRNRRDPPKDEIPRAKVIFGENQSEIYFFFYSYMREKWNNRLWRMIV